MVVGVIAGCESYIMRSFNEIALTLYPHRTTTTGNISNTVELQVSSLDYLLSLARRGVHFDVVSLMPIA